MSYRISYLEEHDIIESIFEDTTNLQEIKESTVKGLSLAAEKKCKNFLADCSGLKQGSSILELYSLGNFYVEINVERGTRQAVILPNVKKIENELRFYETVTRNRGFDVRVFSDREKAIAWLLGKE